MKWTLWCGQRSRQKWDLKLNNRKGLQENPTRCHPTRKTTPRHLSAPKLIIRLQQFKKLCTLLDLCVSSLRRGHANLLCIVPILTDDPRRESKMKMTLKLAHSFCSAHSQLVELERILLQFEQECWRLWWCCCCVGKFRLSTSSSDLSRGMPQGIDARLLDKLSGNGRGCSQNRQNWRQIAVNR